MIKSKTNTECIIKLKIFTYVHSDIKIYDETKMKGLKIVGYDILA